MVSSAILYASFVLVFSSFTWASPASLLVRSTLSPDGTCGGTKGYSCQGSNYGNSCSKNNQCGRDSSYYKLSQGCQPAYGYCAPRGSVSPDGSCGGSDMFVCSGSNFGDSCGRNDLCGRDAGYSGDGCQPQYGYCQRCTTSALPSFTTSTVRITTTIPITTISIQATTTIIPITTTATTSTTTTLPVSVSGSTTSIVSTGTSSVTVISSTATTSTTTVFTTISTTVTSTPPGSTSITTTTTTQTVSSGTTYISGTTAVPQKRDGGADSTLRPLRLLQLFHESIAATHMLRPRASSGPSCGTIISIGSITTTRTTTTILTSNPVITATSTTLLVSNIITTTTTTSILTSYSTTTSVATSFITVPGSTTTVTSVVTSTSVTATTSSITSISTATGTPLTITSTSTLTSTSTVAAVTATSFVLAAYTKAYERTDSNTCFFDYYNNNNPRIGADDTGNNSENNYAAPVSQCAALCGAKPGCVSFYYSSTDSHQNTGYGGYCFLLAYKYRSGEIACTGYNVDTKYLVVYDKVS